MHKRRMWYVKTLTEKCFRSVTKELPNNNIGNVQLETAKEKSSSHQPVFPLFDEWRKYLLE